MKKYALLGENISYSLSKNIYEYFFDKKRIKASYDIIDVSRDSFNKEYLDNIFNKDYKAINITKPYKERVISFIDSFSNEVEYMRSVNNIVKDDNILKGYNTDYLGLIDSFRYYNLKFSGKKILILGAGGACKSLIYALEKEVNEVFIYNRSKEKISLLKGISSIKIEEDISKDSNFDIIFNTTSINFFDYLDNLNLNIDKKTFLYDLNYFYEQREGYNNYVDGLMMLLYQASYNFYLWFNKEVEIDKDLIRYIRDDSCRVNR